jgi:tetratricopeptide (TPR) repeat protein
VEPLPPPGPLEADTRWDGPDPNFKPRMALWAAAAALFLAILFGFAPPPLIFACGALVWAAKRLDPPSLRELGYAGEREHVRRVAERAIRTQWAADEWGAFWLNEVVNACISTGQYRLARRVYLAKRRRKHERDPNSVLAAMNLAEALYNQGRWRRAEWLVRSLPREFFEEPILLNGSMLQLAWIEERLGRAELAVWLADGADENGLPYEFRAEAWFTRASAAMARGELERAALLLEQAESVLVRASSKRNCGFLRARLAVAHGDDAAALRFSTLAAAVAYRGQGGDGLYRLGDIHARAGRIADAEASFALCVERDPESEWAARAAVRLKALGDV